MADLDDNFGIFFESDNFIEDVNKKKKDINITKNIMESFSNYKFLNTIREILHLKFEYKYYHFSNFSFYSHNDYPKFINYNSYPFVYIIKSIENEPIIILLSEKIKEIITKEKEINRKNNKLKIKKPKEKNKDKIKKDRKIIKFSYAKNTNKVYKKYMNKKVIKLLLKYYN